MVSFMGEHGALDFELASAAHDEGQVEVGQLLLLHLLLGGALHIRGLDGGAVAGNLAEEARGADGRVNSRVICGAVVSDAGDEKDHHQNDGCADNNCKDGFCDAIVLLQNTDHAWLTTFTSGESRMEITLPRIFAHGSGAIPCGDASHLLAGAHRKV